MFVSQSIGAVNCIIRRPNDGKLFGCNTDYVGAISAIEDGLRGFLYMFHQLSKLHFVQVKMLKS